MWLLTTLPNNIYYNQYTGSNIQSQVRRNIHNRLHLGGAVSWVRTS